MSRLTATFLVWNLLAAAGGAAQGDEARGGEARPAEVVERILELQRQIDALMARLPPELREEVRRRLAEQPERPAAKTTVDAPEPVLAEPVDSEPVVPEPVDAAPEPVESIATVEPAHAEPPAAPAVNAPPAEPPLPRLRPRRAPCNTLQPLDEDGDGAISAADRYWRYLYLWTDRNGDRQVQEREVESAYDRGVRQIGVSLETFVRKKGNIGEVRVENRVVLDLSGNGFSERSRGDDGILMVDATDLRRGDGPSLLGPEGEVLEGFQPFSAGLSIRTAAGQTTALDCPRGD